MLELAVLGLLKERPMHGYEVQKQLDERLGRSFSPGSLYPTLKRLVRQGAIEAEAVAGGLRMKKVYRITPAGESLFERLVDHSDAQDVEDREAFQVKFAFSRYARPETRRRLLERRRGYLLEKLDRIKASLRTLRERVDAYSLELMRYGESETEHEIHWLDLQLENEQAAVRKAERKAQRASRKAAREGERTVRRASRSTPNPGTRNPGARNPGARNPGASNPGARNPGGRHTSTTSMTDTNDTTASAPTTLTPTRPAAGRA